MVHSLAWNRRKHYGNPPAWQRPHDAAYPRRTPASDRLPSVFGQALWPQPQDRGQVACAHLCSRRAHGSSGQSKPASFSRARTPGNCITQARASVAGRSHGAAPGDGTQAQPQRLTSLPAATRHQPTARNAGAAKARKV